MIKFDVRGSVLGMLVVLGFIGLPAALAGELHDAVEAGDVVRVHVLLAGGADVNELDLYGSALHIAAAQGSEDIAKALVGAGADLEVEGEPARAHPLHLAALFNQTAVVALLLERGAQVDARNAEGTTPLMISAQHANFDVAKILLAHGADPRARDSVSGDTVLHYAAIGGNIEIVALLLPAGAEVNQRSTSNGEPPLFYAANQGRLEVMKMLVARGAALGMTGKDGKTAIQGSHVPDSAKELLRSFGLKE